MAKRVTKDATILLGELDISGLANNIGLDVSIEPVDVTNYASGGWKEFLAGLKDVEIPLEGFMDEATLGAALADMVDNDTLLPLGVTHTRPPAADDIAFLAEVLLTQYQRRQAIGQAFGYSAQFKTSRELIRGKVIFSAFSAFDETGGASAEIELEAIASGEVLHGAVHVLAKEGTSPTLDILVESDLTGFASPTTRYTVPQFNDAIGSHYFTVAGPITDTFYRINATIGGSATPGFKYVVILGRAPAVS